MLDIIVFCHNNLGRTIRCLEAIYKYTTIPFNLCVVDDSTDMTPDYIKSLSQKKGNITHAWSAKRYKGWCDCLSVGMANTSHEFVVYIGDSCDVEPEWFTSLLWIMQNNPDVGIVVPKFLTPIGVIEGAGLYFDKELKPMFVGNGAPAHHFTHIRDCAALPLAAAMMRREALVDSIDKDTYLGFMGLEDIDLCLTVKQKGWRLTYCGLSAVYHQDHATRPCNAQSDLEYEENFTRFVNKWGKYIKENISLIKKKG